MTSAGAHHNIVRMNRFDRDVLAYMLLWDPRGGLGDEDLFPMFGMNVAQFRQRFTELVGSYERRVLHAVDRDLVECARRYRARCADSHTGGRSGADEQPCIS